MAALFDLRRTAEQKRLEFIATVHDLNPDFDVWHWYRARAAMDGHVGRLNDDTSFDQALASSESIQQAHEAYIKATHAFYMARDGEGGFLGSL